jgi:hypothetical protein
MKSKFLFIILAIGSFSVFSFAQERNFTVEISLKDNNRWTIGKDNLAKVKITNKSEQVLNTKDLKSLNFYLSRCPRVKKCATREDIYVAYSGIEAKNLKQNESLEFQANLTDLYWKPAISSSIDFKYPNNFKAVPFINKYFFADIKIFDKYLELENQSIEIPINNSYESNEVILEYNLKKVK